MDPIITTLLAILFTIIIYLLYQAWKVNQFWKEKGIPYVKPWLFLGNASEILFMRKNIGQVLNDLCKRFPDEPVIGYYDFLNPALVVKDPEMIEKILVKDFIHFTDQGMIVDEDRNPLESNLFSMTGKRWRATRNKLSPVFTTGKLKGMFDNIATCGNELITQLENSAEAEMRDILGRFTMDVIGSTIFGMEPRNLADPENEYRQMGKRVFALDSLQIIKLIIASIFPWLAKMFNISFIKRDILEYFSDIIRKTVQYRRESGYKRNDFIQMMMQLQDKGYVEIHSKDPDDDYLNIEPSYTTEKFELTHEQLVGQAFTFLTTGFDAITLTLTYTLYELSKHPEIQLKARTDVRREVEKSGGTLTYDCIREMIYLEQCLKETMRKYPPALAFFRVCTKDYMLPSGVKVFPGQTLLIAVPYLHGNPKYYPEPEKYEPGRFDPENTLPSCAYIPFGNGPRMCIAMRFAMLQMKYSLAKLLMHYNFQINPKTKEPLTVSVKSFFTAPNEKIIFDVQKLITN